MVRDDSIPFSWLELRVDNTANLFLFAVFVEKARRASAAAKGLVPATLLGFKTLLMLVVQNSTLSPWYWAMKRPKDVPIPKVKARRFILPKIIRDDTGWCDFIILVLADRQRREKLMNSQQYHHHESIPLIVGLSPTLFHGFLLFLLRHILRLKVEYIFKRAFLHNVSYEPNMLQWSSAE